MIAVICASEAALEFLGARRRRLVAERAKEFGRRRLVEDADDLGIEASEDRIWQPRRSDQPLPRNYLVPRKTTFGDGRRIRQSDIVLLT